MHYHRNRTVSAQLRHGRSEAERSSRANRIALWAIAVSLSGAAGFTLGAVPQTVHGSHWHAKGCPGQGSNVYHADYIDEFPDGCKEFILVDNRTDAPLASFWEDEIHRKGVQ